MNKKHPPLKPFCSLKEIKDLAESKKVFEGELDGRLHCDLKRLGLRLGDALQIVKSLTLNDFIETKQDKEPPADVYKKKLGKQILYIKLAIQDSSDGSFLEIISFHEDRSKK